MDNTLGYLRESLSNYTDDDQELGNQIYKKLEQKSYQNEEDFIKDLNDIEMHYLNKVVSIELHHAQQEQDEKRVKELNEVYELLF
ncbi:sigma-G-dependent sporulation-specific acid-soluble spore protein CsgA [Bacillus sp. FJAT-45350]|uniref:sigma-G-dependent sporulation-specific acid-soluble spore protein CsgA n=1 Tax=Bacillus sp. FJAT-45350 TaxID=2011014 RepID=UPI000BB8B482|nr:sigma-G-dependent sporulation-specific acid-soluble spore protein CsgA [Bacillus sp. FJAT-45350]